jgi:hypothetical protein
MRILQHTITTALGITTLCLLFLIGPFVSPNHEAIYHLTGSAAPVFISVGIYFGYLWLLIAGVLLIAARYRIFWFPVWLGILVFLPWVVLKNCVMLEQWPISHRTMVNLFLLMLATFLVVVFSRPAFLQKRFPALQRFASVVFAFAALVGLTTLVRLPWYAWAARDLNPQFVATPRSASGAGSTTRHRVIWILFDELSQDQVYGHRYPGLGLPAFDQLADRSVVFTHVIPAGIMTERAIPSLFSGLPADDIRVSEEGQLRALHNPATGVWQPFNQYTTVFQDARLANHATGVVGWMNPYCRLLPRVLDRCFWIYRSSETEYLQSDRGWKAQMMSPFRFVASYLSDFLRLRIGPVQLGMTGPEMHIADYVEIRDETDKLLSDPSIDFVFLHLPVPHPEGIYDRKRMTFATTGSSYLDNLVLTDQCLAHIRLLLEKQHQWDSSTVVVMGDHSWRTALTWKRSPNWTPEEEQASHGGQFDDRPGFIVKMPMQQIALQVDTPFPAVQTRALLDEIFENKVETATELKSWAETQR